MNLIPHDKTIVFKNSKGKELVAEDTTLADGHITPYDHLDEIVSMQRLGIWFRFDRIITRDQGKSVCPDCGAVYMGDQGKCSVKRRAVSGTEQTSYRWRGHTVKSETLNVGETYTIFSTTYRIDTVSEVTCDAICKWDLEQEFRDQKDLFLAVRFVAHNQASLDYKAMNAANHSLVIPKDRLQEARINNLDNQVYQLTMQNQQLMNAVRTIAEKMNAAGQNLSFGF